MMMPERRSGAAWQDSIVFVSRDQEESDLASLALFAAGIGHRVFWRHGWQIATAADDAASAEAEIIACLEENQRPPPVAPDSFTPIFRAMNLVISGGLCLAYAITGPWQDHSPFFAAASAQASAIAQGEWYRAVTALCLHADSVHLISNAGIGLIILYFYFHTLGNGLGLFALIASAAAANLINACLHGGSHDSVGFSTALFAGIGILSSFQFQRHRVYGRFGWWMPLMAACALLAMLGGEGKQTDFGAHLGGLLIGLVTGYALSWRKIFGLRKSFAAQSVLFGLAVVLTAVCWRLALGR
ncbi:MAG: rhomboid family intramembrane serine protease [Desulfobulbaceae bacterium]|jgi:membrane associated rhomboid family serine protease|nr:rhomboid family intramembrane serine protease [Desulfobulbaceae bacterium]